MSPSQQRIGKATTFTWWQQIVMAMYLLLCTLNVILCIAAPYYGIGILSHHGVAKLSIYHQQRLSGHFHALVGGEEKRTVQNQNNKN